MEKYYKIAGLTVAMDVMGRTRKQAEAYLCDPVEKADIELNNNYGKMMERFPQFSEEEAQYHHTGICFYAKLMDFQGLMLHSSAVVVDGRAYLFAADSGTGKSTHTQLWLDKFGDRAYILNDDKPALRLIDGVWYACGTPWSGKHDISKPEIVPLAGIAVLARDTTNHIERYNGVEAVYNLLKQTLRLTIKHSQLLELLDQLVMQVPVWKIYCNMDPEAAEVSYNAMSGDERE